MRVTRSGSAAWKGGVKNGKGTLSTQSGALDQYPYGFASRFEGLPGSNPEELLAAAHAGCFTMALNLVLEGAGLSGPEMQTNAAVTLEKIGDGFSITAIKLTLTASVPPQDQKAFIEVANTAKEICPVSKLFNAPITLDVELS